MTTINDKALELYCAAKSQALTTRLRDERGQVAAEYMGLVALAAFIIFALVQTTNVDELIANKVKALVNAIAKGEDPAGAGG
jgi:Flp pilus assembly pilin Flp